MNDRNLIIVMFVLTLIGFVTIKFFNACSSVAHAQQTQLHEKPYNNFDIHYNGFSMLASHFETITKCKEMRGRWESLTKEYLPKNRTKVSAVGLCSFRKQAFSFNEHDNSTVLVSPQFIFFAFNPNGEVEFAVFGYEFRTWSARDFAEKSIKKHMRDYFIFGGQKIKNNVYKLEDTQFYLELLESNKDNIFHLGVGISREQFAVYKQK